VLDGVKNSVYQCRFARVDKDALRRYNQGEDVEAASIMRFTRRDTIKLLGYSAAWAGTRSAFGQTPTLPLTSGPFQATRGSLDAYQVPEWFRDAKFGIWSHWGPQSGVEDGDWFARNMYIQGSPQYEYHLKTYGHPSKVGYKDLIPLFKGDKWDPEHLMDLYVKAGAKYFVSMGVHHDNFDMWNSKYQPRWNATATGPMRDIVGLYKQAARKRGLRFGVSEHLSNSFDWLAPAHTSDTTGPLAGISYEGTNPLFADLYHSYTLMPPDFARTAKDMGRVAPDEWKLEYFNRIKDLIDQHQPDLLYTDGGIPFDEYGLATVAEVYNVSAGLHSGKVEAVYCSKAASDCAVGTCIVDHERGVSDAISTDPWQTDTCIGVWHYKRGQIYKTPKKVIDLLVDIVSKNGNLLLNFPLPNSGELDPEEMKVLEGITSWMAVNSEGIYGSRPWKIYGDGPSTEVVVSQSGFNESKQPGLTAQDVRFTTKGKILYAYVMGIPAGEFVIKPLAGDSPQQPGKILNVQLLGYQDNLHWKQDNHGLKVRMPAANLSAMGITLKVTLA
jgi:alpha-L-fucosidase